MLSKISLAINAILLLLVVNLYLSKEKQNSEGNTKSNISSTSSNSVKIAYINTDTLDVNYQYALDIVATLEKEANKKQRRLERKATQAQQEFNNLQQSARSMTPSQLQAAQERAYQMEQEIQMMQNDLANEFAMDQNKLQIALVNNLDSFLIRYNDTANYDFILKKHNGSQILVSKDQFDITVEVLKLLNEEYLGKNSTGDSLQ